MIKSIKKKFIPVSIEEVKVRFWSQTSGAGTPDSVQRWLQVARPLKTGQQAGKEEKKRIRKINIKFKKKEMEAERKINNHQTVR